MQTETKQPDKKINKIEINDCYGFSSLYIQGDKESVSKVAAYATQLNLELQNIKP